MDEEKRHTPPSPMRQIKAKKACDHRESKRRQPEGRENGGIERDRGEKKLELISQKVLQQQVEEEGRVVGP